MLPWRGWTKTVSPARLPETAPRSICRKLGLASLTTAILLTIGLGPAGCATTSFDGTVFRTKQTTFRVGPRPASWKRLETQGDRGLLSYRDDAHHATIVLNGRCDEPSDDAPLPSLTQHLFLLFTERTIEEEATIPFDGREARRTVLSAKLDGVPKHFVVLVAKKDNCVYDFVLIVDENADAVSQKTVESDFQSFVAGFHAEPR
jgi:hypothetical protein